MEKSPEIDACAAGVGRVRPVVSSDVAPAPAGTSTAHFGERVECGRNGTKPTFGSERPLCCTAAGSPARESSVARRIGHLGVPRSRRMTWGSAFGRIGASSTGATDPRRASLRRSRFREALRRPVRTAGPLRRSAVRCRLRPASSPRHDLLAASAVSTEDGLGLVPIPGGGRGDRRETVRGQRPQ